MPQKNRSLWKLGLYLAILLALALSLAGIQDHHRSLPQDELHTLDQWYYYQDGQRIDVSLPATVRLEGGGDLVLFCDCLADDDTSMTVSLKGGVYRPQILYGESPLYVYDDTDFPRNVQMRSKVNCTAALPAELGAQFLTLVFEDVENGVFHLPAVYVGRSSAIFRQQCSADFFTLIIVFTMILLGAIAAGTSAYLTAVHMRDRRFLAVAVFLFLCAAWCALDSSLVQLLSDFSPWVCVLSFYAFMTLPIPLILFVQDIGEMRRRRSLDLFLLLFCANAILQGILNYAADISFIDMLFVTHLLLASGTLSIGGLLLTEYRRTKNREILATLLSFCLLGGFGLAALLLYWGLEISYYGIIFECGLLIFMISLLTSLLTAMTATLRFRTEALVYKRLSQEDRLTGLGNRRGFDNYLDGLENTAESHQNVALIFMDLSRLKAVNDTYGHSAGDELIIGAARCMEKVFGERGSCFRIGGDEFAVIIPSPTEDEAIWRTEFQETLAAYNKSHPFPLSIAFGVSLLRDEDGHLKRFSDWKYEADQAMYRDKQAQHACQPPEPSSSPQELQERLF